LLLTTNLKSDQIQNDQFNMADHIFKKHFNFYEKYLGIFWIADYKSKVRSSEKNG